VGSAILPNGDIHLVVLVPDGNCNHNFEQRISDSQKIAVGLPAAKATTSLAFGKPADWLRNPSGHFPLPTLGCGKSQNRGSRSSQVSIAVRERIHEKLCLLARAVAGAYASDCARKEYELRNAAEIAAARIKLTALDRRSFVILDDPTVRATFISRRLIATMGGRR
jgi:hypothetical protein